MRTFLLFLTLLTLVYNPAVAQRTEKYKVMHIETKDGLGELIYEVQNINQIYFETRERELPPVPAKGYEYVDLDLPSGVLWATCNIGAEKPEDSGFYFAWGETEYNKSRIPKWDTYKFGYAENALTKYCINTDYGLNGFMDGKRILDPEDDAATKIWGKQWRMPNFHEIWELTNSCDWTKMSVKGVSGYKVSSKSNPEKYIFLPAAGTNQDITSTFGLYWSSSLYENEPHRAYCLSFWPDSEPFWGPMDRYECFPIRPVYAHRKWTPTELPSYKPITETTISDKTMIYENDVTGRFDIDLSSIQMPNNGNIRIYAEINPIINPEENISHNAYLLIYNGDWSKEFTVYTLGDSEYIEINSSFYGNGEKLIIEGKNSIVTKVTYVVYDDGTEPSQPSQPSQPSLPEEPSTPSENGHEYVDLGLPSGVLWATCNVGADKPEDYGDYFAWGETQTKSSYDEYSYKHGDGMYPMDLTKYCTNYDAGSVDNKTTLDAADDAATQNWGGKWRMPTQDEVKELLDKCTWKAKTVGGINGFQITSKSNSNSIFLPLSGYKSDSNENTVGFAGHYWTSTLNTDVDNKMGHELYLIYMANGQDNSATRDWGMTVRPVMKK